MEEKRLIRKQIFAARKQCSDAQVEEWSHQITDQVLKLSEFVKAKHILAYADYNHEVMTRYIIMKPGCYKRSGSPEGCGKGYDFLPPY